MVKLLIEAPELGSTDLRQLKDLFYGGSAMPEVVMRRAVSALPHV
jgi:hypothetical protein